MTMTTKVLKYEKKTRVWKLAIEVLALPPHHILRPLDQPHHLLDRALWVLLINPNEWQMGAQTICSKTMMINFVKTSNWGWIRSFCTSYYWPEIHDWMRMKICKMLLTKLRKPPRIMSNDYLKHKKIDIL